MPENAVLDGFFAEWGRVRLFLGGGTQNSSGKARKTARTLFTSKCDFAVDCGHQHDDWPT
ncbi:hypothetical protein [Pseudomonas borbori]|uniref:hypothetical protein n=1 Tax=Pseudomonas borbori TaxID=289003 RepID=UPI0011313685|nr:hypothetical protein [Pseudomonas borbori]